MFVFYGNGQSGTGWFRLIYLLSALAFLGLYSMLWTRGRAVFLALALLFACSYIQFEVHRDFETVHVGAADAETVVPILIPFQFVANPGAQTSFGNTGFANIVPRTGDLQAIVALVLGVDFLVVGGWLIRRGYAGAAVAFLVIGALEAFSARGGARPERAQRGARRVAGRRSGRDPGVRRVG